MMLWTAEDIANATGGKLQGKWEANSVSIDTRTLEPGALYVAIKGERFDGHDFIEDAYAKGAVAVLAEKAEGNAVIVQDMLEALTALGKAARTRMQRKLVGITGSVGKTSAKEMLAIALQGMGNIYHTKGNCNNHIGLPLTLANMPQKTDYAIMEMGMNHAGEIAHLSHIGQPDLAMITTVEAVHIEHFDSVADIADAKAEIFEGMATGGIAILNRDNPYHDQLKDKAAHLNALSFGAHEDANARLLDYQMNANSSQIISEINGKQLKYTMSALGKHWGLLATAILLMVDQLGEDITLAAQNLSNFSESKGRGQMLQLANNITLIDDSYNASPVSMKAALAKLGALPGRRIAILGEMLELGEDSQAMHEDLLDDIIKANIARVFCCGAGIESLFKCLPSELQGAYANTVDALEEFVLESLESGDMVLVKGSHGSHVYQLVETLTK